MSKITLTDLANLQNENTAVNAINTNNQVIELAFDNTLSRDGTAPNQMQAVLDMNSHQIINLPNPVSENSPLRLADLNDFIGGGTINAIPAGGTINQALAKDSSADYDVSWKTITAGKNYYLSNYANLQAACDAAEAADGGTVIIDVATAFATTVNLDGRYKPLRITGFGVPSGGGAWAPYIAYTGTGTALSLIGCVNIEIDHCFFYCTNVSGTAYIINAKDASYLNIHDNVFSTVGSNASNIGINLDTSVSPRIRGNSFYITGGTGIRGVAPAGNFSVKAEIAENYFATNTNISISAPGQAWSIVSNTAQDPATCFLDVGPAGTCDTVYLNGNDIDDGTGAKTWVRSNAGSLISINNRYTNAGTCISQTNSTGAVTSIGDRLNGTVGVAIGTGNYLTIINPDQGHLPTTLYTGTPANTTNNFVSGGGAAKFLGSIESGLSGSYNGGLKLWNTTSGNHYSELTPATGASGTCSNSLPSTTGGTVLTTNSTATVSNKTLGNSNIATLRDDRFTLQDSGDTTKQGVFELSGLTTATTRTYTLPDASGTLLYSGGPLGTPSSGNGSNITNVNAATLGGATFAAPGAIGGGTAAAGTFTAVTASTVDAPVIRASGTLTNTNGGTGSTFATLVVTGGSGANGGAYLQFCKNTTVNPTHFAGHESVIFAGGSTSSNYVLYNTGSVGAAGRVYTASTTDNAVTFASTTASTSSSTGGVIISGGAGIAGAVHAGGEMHTSSFFQSKAPTTLTGTSGTVSATDSSVIFNPSGSFTATLPSAASYPGRWLHVKSIAAQTIASASSNVVPRAGGAAGTALLASGAGNWATLQSDGTNWIIMAGN